MLGIGVQHVFSGFLVLYGFVSRDATYSAHGMLCEMGWEVKDVVCLFGGLYPYGSSSEVKPAIKRVIAFHHACVGVRRFNHAIARSIRELHAKLTCTWAPN